MAKVTIDNFDQAVEKILQDYGDDITADLSEITERIGKEGVKMMRSSASIFNRTGKYKKSWKAKVERGRLESVVVLYSTIPGLPHLLEYGHAKRGGGRVEGKEHIKPVEEKLIEQFDQKVRAII